MDRPSSARTWTVRPRCAASISAPRLSALRGVQMVWGDQLPAQQMVWGDQSLLGQQMVWGDLTPWGQQMVWGDQSLAQSGLLVGRGHVKLRLKIAGNKDRERAVVRMLRRLSL